MLQKPAALPSLTVPVPRTCVYTRCPCHLSGSREKQHSRDNKERAQRAKAQAFLRASSQRNAQGLQQQTLVTTVQATRGVEERVQATQARMDYILKELMLTAQESKTRCLGAASAQHSPLCAWRWSSKLQQVTSRVVSQRQNNYLHSSQHFKINEGIGSSI